MSYTRPTILVAGLAMSIAGLSIAQQTSTSSQAPTRPINPQTQPAPGSSDWNNRPSTMRQERGTLTESDDRGLRQRINGFVAALNQHDASTLSTFLAQDVDVITPMGKSIQGRDAIETMMSRKTEKDKQCRINLTVSNVRGFGDVAVADLDGTIVGPTMGTWWHTDNDRRGGDGAWPKSTPDTGTGTPGMGKDGAPGTTGTGADGSGRTQPGRDKDGRPGSAGTDGSMSTGGGTRTLRTHVTLVLKRDRAGGEWMIEAGRPSVLPMAMAMGKRAETDAEDEGDRTGSEPDTSTPPTSPSTTPGTPPR